MDLRTRKESHLTATDWVDKYYDRIYPVILRMVANEEVAKDLTQDAFLKAWEKREFFRGDADIGTWLYRIAVNITLTYISKNKRYPTTDIEDSILPSKEEGMQQKAERRSEGVIVKRVISQLPKNYRMALIMHYYEDMKLEDIARVSGISKGTAAWRLFKARKMISGNLKAEGIEL